MRVWLYVLFFLSGAAALVYEVAWVRSLSLVFGGSHLAVATVLAVFMGGLAFGSVLFGPRADRSPRLLRLYGRLELGIAAFAALFLLLIPHYPRLYGPLARLAPDSPGFLTFIRVGLTFAALIGPATLMGGTLPVLSRVAFRETGGLRHQLPLLYAINTLGAVAGSLAAGFLLLEHLGVQRTIGLAMGTNLLIGLICLRMREVIVENSPRTAAELAPSAVDEKEGLGLSLKLVLWGIGAGGFCSLGYEVLWTRTLTLVVGTSVYSFTIMLVAFLGGIGAGSLAFGWWERRRASSPKLRRQIGSFAGVQVAIGLAALFVTAMMRDLPGQAIHIQGLLASGGQEFEGRQLASALIAVATMFVPAVLLGIAFPLAGVIHARALGNVGRAVGSVLAHNTIGAILGSTAAGFVLIQAFGIERSLILLALVNIGLGMTLFGAMRGRGAAVMAAVGASLVVVVVAADLDGGRLWDRKFFAIFQNNHRTAFDTPFKIQDALENTDVLYFFEGANESISVVRPKGAQQAFVVNGRTEASTAPADVQCQRALGHLPMLLHPAPKTAFVLGTGSGMTLGSVAAHPGLESVVLAEIEPGVLGATRTFAEYNHNVLDDARLEIVFNDGRNYLATTDKRFDVITADPIHPWSGGAAYLYTAEYFDLVASRLEQGGIASQWLPIYELTPKDIATVVRTFTGSFRHVMVWLTYYDAELIGSNQPILIDEAALARRMAEPVVAKDLGAVEMGSVEDLLSYFIAGTGGARSLGEAGVINTDDNLYLEFSAPHSLGRPDLITANVKALAAVRESVAPYLVPSPDLDAQASRIERDNRLHAAGRIYARAHQTFLAGHSARPEMAQLLAELDQRSPGYAPGRFLKNLLEEQRARAPRLMDRASLPLSDATSGPLAMDLVAVAMKVGPSRGVVVVADNAAREIFGQLYFDGPADELEVKTRAFASEVVAAARRSHEDAGTHRGREASARRLRELVAAKVAEWSKKTAADPRDAKIN